jgi:ethanolaminephosphotransferase
VRSHRYKGSCDSLYYKYIQSPLCDWIVSKLPMWLAPNLITLIGFSFNIGQYLLMLCLYGNSTSGPIDSWYIVCCAVTYTIYSTFDNCDGKQARRTGSGSPLGMMFDHGLDACTAVLQIIMMQRVGQVGDHWTGMLCMTMTTVPFYYLTLETYYLGEMNLPSWSGPDDTQVAYAIGCLILAVIGTDIFLYELEFMGVKTQVNHMVLYVLVIFEVVSIVSSFFSNVWAARKKPYF